MLKKALKDKKYIMLTVNIWIPRQGVLSGIKAFSELVHRISRETLVVVDGACSVGSEEIQLDEWRVDVVLTASKKGIGCPAGLCIMMSSGRTVESLKNRKTPPTLNFASSKNWLPSNYVLSFNPTLSCWFILNLHILLRAC